MYAVIALGFVTIVVGFVYFFLTVKDKKTEGKEKKVEENEPLVAKVDKKELIYAKLPAEPAIIYEKLPPLQKKDNNYGKIPLSKKEEGVYEKLPEAPAAQKTVIYDKLPDVSANAKDYYAKKIPAKLGISSN